MSVPVVAISGHPGSGKTTLTRRLAAHFGVPALYYDDYETITARPPAEVREWIARGSDYDQVDLAPLLKAIEAAGEANPPFVLLDTLLGRAHAASRDAITVSLWLDVPADVALARKLRQAGARVGDDPARAREFAGWVASYTQHYEQFIADTYTLQAERVRPRADVRLGQWRNSDQLLAEAAAAIAAHGLAASPRPSLLTAMERFGAGFGFERSVKLSPGSLNDDRYITSVHRDDLGPDPRGVIATVGAAEAIPEAQWARMMTLLREADVIHFGHEGGDEPVRKVYLEFISKLREAARANRREPQMLYLALKWRPGEEHGAAFNRYMLVPDHQVPARMIETLRKGYEGRTGAPSLQVGIETIRLAASRAGQMGIMFIEVEEEGTPRFSYDITIYSARLAGRELEPILRPMLEAYGIAPAAADKMLATIAPSPIGHVSVGIGRDGRDFVTVYYGLESRKQTVNA
jgi:uridine kinase